MSAADIIGFGAGATTVGQVRSTNEDRFLVDNQHQCFAVADGIGGLPFGERASDSAVRALAREIKSNPKIEAEALMLLCHKNVKHLGRVISRKMGIGTTLTFIRLQRGWAELGHVGDCAAFLLNKEKASIRKLTTNHVASGPKVNIANAPQYVNFQPQDHLERYLGQAEPLAVDVIRFQPVPGDSILICSDGLLRKIDEPELVALLKVQPEPFQFARVLTEIANIRGGQDNTTTVVVSIKNLDLRDSIHVEGLTYDES